MHPQVKTVFGSTTGTALSCWLLRFSQATAVPLQRPARPAAPASTIGGAERLALGIISAARTPRGIVQILFILCIAAWMAYMVRIDRVCVFGRRGCFTAATVVLLLDLLHVVVLPQPGVPVPESREDYRLVRAGCGGDGPPWMAHANESAAAARCSSGRISKPSQCAGCQPEASVLKGPHGMSRQCVVLSVVCCVCCDVVMLSLCLCLCL